MSNIIFGLGISLIIAIWLLVVAGWWVTLFLWVIPTLSIPITEIFTLFIWDAIGVVLFFTVWLSAMLYCIAIVLWNLRD